MNRDPYKYVSQIYQHLMRSINYADWARYLYTIFSNYNIKDDTALELSSGNCMLANQMNKFFGKIFVSDLSIKMLKQKSCDGIDKICCDMNYLPFKRKFSFIYSTFDSINYLDDLEKLFQFFKSMKSVIDKKGVFVFDVSLENNSLKHVRELNRKGIANGIKYSQHSDYDKKNKIHTNLFKIKLSDNSIIEETHTQKIFEFYDYFEAIEDAGLFVSECYNAFSFEDADPQSERAQFIVKHGTG
ncbi:MAG: class I SAM-dependent methyltransferase [Melioribacteraceae bacterium]|nr:class I SAM-dependent methyltransferase [Melioribacteraceae bacterium]MCF8354861.1 class I SAM-dependent methyltransferase [Melioribacteraceae bacterium]MCF8392968.1 class I SAM-dependent methyltransferase [Melioribacteraceae bacterium]MCF8417289.1 class I SAM-dependent methyltransferase [Melioribacteraceae bacterium]